MSNSSPTSYTVLLLFPQTSSEIIQLSSSSAMVGQCFSSLLFEKRIRLFLSTTKAQKTLAEITYYNRYVAGRMQISMLRKKMRVRALRTCSLSFGSPHRIIVQGQARGQPEVGGRPSPCSDRMYMCFWQGSVKEGFNPLEAQESVHTDQPYPSIQRRLQPLLWHTVRSVVASWSTVSTRK